MSVKQMTDDEIRENIETIAIAWPEGIPPEQVDNVNALVRELKRRGVSLTGPPRPRRGGDVRTMDRDALERELRDLSASLGRTPDNEEAQARFQEVRAALRSRMTGEGPEPQRAPLPPRMLELPEEDPVVPKKTSPSSLRGPASPTETKRRDVVLAGTTETTITATADTVNGFSATSSRAGCIVVKYERSSVRSCVSVVRQFTVAQMDEFIGMCREARDRAFGMYREARDRVISMPDGDDED